MEIGHQSIVKLLLSNAVNVTSFVNCKDDVSLYIGGVEIDGMNFKNCSL